MIAPHEASLVLKYAVTQIWKYDAEADEGEDLVEYLQHSDSVLLLLSISQCLWEYYL